MRPGRGTRCAFVSGMKAKNLNDLRVYRKALEAADAISDDRPRRSTMADRRWPIDDHASGSTTRFFAKSQATRTLIKYSPIIGTATMHWLAMSGLGVMAAATMKMPRIAYLK